MEGRWGTDMTIRFINEYHRHTCLWDPCHPLYKQREARLEAYSDLARLAGQPAMDVKMVRTKIRVLRNTYTNELSKIRKSMECDGDRGEVYVPRIPWFKYMDFLRRTCSQKPRDDYYEPPLVIDTADSAAASQDDDSQPAADFAKLPELLAAAAKQKLIAKSYPPRRNKHSARQPKRERNANASDNHNAWSFQDGNAREMDEFEAFGRNVVIQLRNLPLEEALETQIMIQTILKDQRVKLLRAREMQSTVINMKCEQDFNF